MDSTRSALKRLYSLYSDEAWLPLYYPLTYFAKVVREDFNRDDSRSPHEKSELCCVALGFGRNAIWILILCSFPIVILFSGSLVQQSTLTWSEAEKETYINHGSKHPIPKAWLITDPHTGLTEAEVTERRRRDGWNESYTGIRWILVIGQFILRPTNVALEAASLLALVRHDWRDLLAVSGILAWLARRTFHAATEHSDLALSLAAQTDLTVACGRDHAVVQMKARELVVGDIVHVQEGDTIPADCRLVSKTDNFSVSQSAITGDAKDVHKHEGDICYAITTVSHGHATLLVQGIGYNTFIGRTLTMLEGTQDRSKPMPRHLKEYRTLFCNLSIGIAILILTLTCLNTILTGRFDLRVLLTLLIISAPVSVNTAVNFYGSLGASQLSSIGALIASQTNVEALAGIDVLLVDKTGTLTKNELGIVKPQLIAGTTEELLLTAYLSLPPDEASYDPIDKAFAMAMEDYPEAQQLAKQYEYLEFQPFDPDTRLIQATVRSPAGEKMICVRGTPKAVLDLYTGDRPGAYEIAEKYKSICSQLAAEGHRSFSVARKIGNQKWELLGIVPLHDPIRDDSASMIKLAASMGVSFRIITGDATMNAVKTAESLDMGVKACNLGELLEDAELSESEVNREIEVANIYTEVFPEHKSQLVHILQEQGHKVAITGDSVSDAPCLRRADCGIAVEGATETAQSAADIIMQTNGLKPIVKAIQTSRQVLHLVQSYLVYRAVTTLHLTFILALNTWTGGEPLDTTLLIIAMRLGDLFGCLLDGQWTMAFPARPSRWSTRQVWIKAVPISLILTMGTWLAISDLIVDHVQTKQSSRPLLCFWAQTTLQRSGIRLSFSKSS